MYYLQSRYYDPEVGKFINGDDIAFLGATGTVLSFNLYSYCENNPVTFSDSYGQKQRLVLARQLLRNSKVLVLDEATGSVDPYTETKIFEAIEGLQVHI